MASPQASNKIFSNVAHELIDFDPDVTTPVDVKWVPTRDFRNFSASIMRTIGTGNVDAFLLLGNTEADGSGTDVTLKSHALGSEPDALGDQLHLEVTAEEMAQEAADAGIASIKGFSASVELATGTDEFVASYIRMGALRAQDALTADVVA